MIFIIKEEIEAILLDFSKAFDNVPHQRLLMTILVSDGHI